VIIWGLVKNLACIIGREGEREDGFLENQSITKIFRNRKLIVMKENLFALRLKKEIVFEILLFDLLRRSLFLS